VEGRISRYTGGPEIRGACDTRDSRRFISRVSPKSREVCNNNVRVMTTLRERAMRWIHREIVARRFIVFSAIIRPLGSFGYLFATVAHLRVDIINYFIARVCSRAFVRDELLSFGFENLEASYPTRYIR